MSKKDVFEGKKAVSYTRYSSHNQSDTSIEAQDQTIDTYCKKHGINLVHKYCDRAYSGTTDQRSAFQQMMHDAENHPEWDAIFIYDFSRFARNHADAIKYKQMLRYNGINVVSVTQDFGTSNESAIVENIIDLINAQYSINNARATHSGMMQNAQTCLHNGGKPPLGYDIDLEGKLVINAVEADTVRRILTWSRKTTHMHRSQRL